MIPLFIALQVGDMLLTSQVWQLESNPIAAFLFVTLGVWPAMLLLKGALIAIAAYQRRMLINCASVVYEMLIAINLVAFI